MAKHRVIDTGTAQFTVAYDGTNYAPFTCSATGELTIAPTGGKTTITGFVRLGASAWITSTSGVVASAGTLDLTSQNTGGGGWGGFLIASNASTASANVRTQRTYAVMARGSVATFTQISTANGSGGGADFSLSCPSAGVVRATNAAGQETQFDLAFFGSNSL